MKKVLFITLISGSPLAGAWGQGPARDAVLRPAQDTPVIQQIGSENRIVFLQKDSEQMPLLHNLSLRQSGENNTLILSDIKNNDARLDIRQNGVNNSLFIEDVRIPLQITQSGGMELSIRGTHSLLQYIRP